MRPFARVARRERMHSLSPHLPQLQGQVQRVASRSLSLSLSLARSLSLSPLALCRSRVCCLVVGARQIIEHESVDGWENAMQLIEEYE